MGTRKVVQVNCTTGEVMEGINVFIPLRQKLKEDFMLTNLKGMKSLSMDNDLKISDWRVLAFLIGCLEYENWLCISQQNIADELKMHRPNVARSLKKLVEKGIIVKGKKFNRTICYRLNAHYGWRGRINKEYLSTYEEHSKLIQFPQLPPSG